MNSDGTGFCWPLFPKALVIQGELDLIVLQLSSTVLSRILCVLCQSILTVLYSSMCNVIPLWLYKEQEEGES